MAQTTDDLAAELGFDLAPSPTKPPTTKKKSSPSSRFDDSSDEETQTTNKKNSSGGGAMQTKSKSNGFDDSGDENEEPGLNSNPSNSKIKNTPKSSTTKANTNKWDDSDDDDDPASRGGGAGGGSSNKPTVKFPSLPTGVQLIQQCSRECTLTNVAKGQSPCPYIRCEQCGYLVAKCGQSATWHDDHGTKDLYLEMRYFYPDWSRYQPSTISPVSDNSSAAYGCQCTWFTCNEGQFSIKTPLGAANFNVQETSNNGAPRSSDSKKSPSGAGGGKFVSSSKQYRELEKADGRVAKPLPRWICCGHPPLK